MLKTLHIHLLESLPSLEKEFISTPNRFAKLLTQLDVDPAPRRDLPILKATPAFPEKNVGATQLCSAATY